MNSNLASQSLDARHLRGLTILFGATALALGVLVAIGTSQALAMLGVALLMVVVVCTVPLDTLAVLAAALVPFQFYFFVPGTNFAMPAAFAFVAAAATRVLLARGLHRQVWIVPAVMFLLAAFIAALGAVSRYEALKGIYGWLPIFACIFIAAQTIVSVRSVDRIVLILVVLGTAQACLGLLEYVAGLDRVIDGLRLPTSAWIFPPNLLNERLSDLSFNWNLDGRALPFGTFINGIDYAIFLAAIMMLALTRAIASPHRAHRAGWLGCAFAMGAALLLTFKGSGWLAFVGGVAVIAFSYAPRFSRKTWVGVLALGLIALILAMPLADSISQRVVFLVQREQNDDRNIGRLRIWSEYLGGFLERPLFGYGLNNSAFLGEPLRTLRYGAFGTNPSSPENSYLETLVETGAFGLVALMSLYVWTFARGVRRIRGNLDALFAIGTLAALVAIWAGNLTVSAFTTEQNGMLMGLLIGMIFSQWNAR